MQTHGRTRITFVSLIFLFFFVCFFFLFFCRLFLSCFFLSPSCSRLLMYTVSFSRDARGTRKRFLFCPHRKAPTDEAQKKHFLGAPAERRSFFFYYEQVSQQRSPPPPFHARRRRWHPYNKQRMCPAYIEIPGSRKQQQILRGRQKLRATKHDKFILSRIVHVRPSVSRF